MTEVYRRMLSEDDDDSPAKCRQRRRRRIQMRRLAAISVSSTAAFPSQRQREDHAESSGCFPEGKRLRMGEASGLLATVTMCTFSGEEVEPTAGERKVTMTNGPVFGTMSISGRSREMEDAISVRTSFCRPDVNLKRPVHFFAVYDGHGGPHVAALCREKMHVFVEEELMGVKCTGESECGRDSSSQEDEHEESWRRVMKRSFERMDEVAISTCACGIVGHQCGCHSMEVALGGSTAVVALLTSEHIVVANCGDSRAVLCRGGKAVPLSVDHKPDRSDELARIEAAGGRVVFVNGARVEGILAMSRAIGDKYLKPVVTSEPEITFTKREPEDECLILASDGLWDVLSCDLACEVARECLKEGSNSATASALNLNAGPNKEDEGAETLYPSRSVLAAALLTRLALGRKSSDNISVIVVDLKES
ncbi:PREDICTED: probable protein phosphatase 2C 75 [Theobroma cacao]|uniref:protein-serine/threonine phosphatase n=1 Tax=Theobroma cacao TaxID=3641 RepID=A0AB32VD61_THECC|nr:PREDICTED: probable protein phosphatase 2C 75 [Theobroma cacao]